MSLQFRQGQVLFVQGALALDPACCCARACPTDGCGSCPTTITVAFTGLACGGGECDGYLDTVFTQDPSCFWWGAPYGAAGSAQLYCEDGWWFMDIACACYPHHEPATECWQNAQGDPCWNPYDLLWFSVRLRAPATPDAEGHVCPPLDPAAWTFVSKEARVRTCYMCWNEGAETDVSACLANLALASIVGS